MPRAGTALNEVIWTEPALRHLQAMRADIEQYNPSAARHVAASLKALGESLNHFPHRGRRVSGTAFRGVVNTYPYVIRYTIEADKVVIPRIRHTSDRPTTP